MYMPKRSNKNKKPNIELITVVLLTVVLLVSLVILYIKANKKTTQLINPVTKQQ